MEDLRAVYTRLSAVRDIHLSHVRSPDRAYVAEEMHAFLVAWLTALPCRVINRATPQCLAGPAWTWEQWSILAGRLGFRVHTTRRTADNLAPACFPPDSRVVHVIGNRCWGEANRLGDRLAALARAAGVDVMSVVVAPANDSGEEILLECSPWLNLHSPVVSEALLDLLLEGTP